MKFCPKCRAQHDNQARVCANCGVLFDDFSASEVKELKQKNSRRDLKIALAGIAALLLCAPFGFLCRGLSAPVNQTATFVNTSATASSSPPVPLPSASPTFDPSKNGLKLISAKWVKGGFGSIALWRVTVQNVSNVPLGDIKFRTAYYSETQNTVGKGGTDALLGKDTIEKVVPPKSTRTFEVNDGFISDEADTAHFELVTWRVLQ